MFLLDTDHCIYILNGKPLEVAERSEVVGRGQMAVSYITMAELIYGACKSRNKAANLATVERLCARLILLPFEDSVVRIFGELKADLDAAGQLNASTAADGRVRRDFDIAIAATALAYGRTLVTHNTSHYAGISGLALEDWHP